MRNNVSTTRSAYEFYAVESQFVEGFKWVSDYTHRILPIYTYKA